MTERWQTNTTSERRAIACNRTVEGDMTDDARDTTPPPAGARTEPGPNAPHDRLEEIEERAYTTAPGTLEHLKTLAHLSEDVPWLITELHNARNTIRAMQAEKNTSKKFTDDRENTVDAVYENVVEVDVPKCTIQQFPGDFGEHRSGIVHVEPCTCTNPKPCRLGGAFVPGRWCIEHQAWRADLRTKIVCKAGYCYYLQGHAGRHSFEKD